MAPTQPSCLLHIGAPKTGSTALQQFLARNSRALADAGWLYPDVSRRGWGHHDLAFLLGAGYPEWASRQPRTLAELVADLAVAAGPAERIIVSSENFYLFSDPARTREVLREVGFPRESVQIVVYLRRQDEMHLSWYNQAVKAQGYSGTIAESIEATFGMWDYAARLAAWSDAFGADRLTIRPYPPGRPDTGDSEFDVRRDFLGLAGIDSGAFEFDPEPANTRLSRDLLEFQRAVNRLPLPTTAKRAYHRELQQLTAATAGSSLFEDPPLLDAAGRRGLLERYAAGNRDLAVRHLGRPDLFPSDPPCQSSAAGNGGTDRWGGLTAEKVACIVGWLLATNPAAQEPVGSRAER